MSMPEFVRMALLRRCLAFASSRPPDVVIGDDYIERWHVLTTSSPPMEGKPRLPQTSSLLAGLARLLGVENVYVHRISGSDPGRHLHCHPWANTTLLLAGVYDEEDETGRRIQRIPGDVVRRRDPKALHRLHLVDGPAWTLFVTGRWQRVWGFACPQGWRPWFEYVDPERPGHVGAGCGPV